MTYAQPNREALSKKGLVDDEHSSTERLTPLKHRHRVEIVSEISFYVDNVEDRDCHQYAETQLETSVIMCGEMLRGITALDTSGSISLANVATLCVKSDDEHPSTQRKAPLKHRHCIEFDSEHMFYVDNVEDLETSVIMCVDMLWGILALDTSGSISLNNVAIEVDSAIVLV